MGSGKRNYRSMVANRRQWRKEEKPIEVEKKKANKEDEDKLIVMWQDLKNKRNKKDKTKKE